MRSVGARAARQSRTAARERAVQWRVWSARARSVAQAERVGEEREGEEQRVGGERGAASRREEAEQRGEREGEQRVLERVLAHELRERDLARRHGEERGGDEPRRGAEGAAPDRVDAEHRER